MVRVRLTISDSEAYIDSEAYNCKIFTCFASFTDT